MSYRIKTINFLYASLFVCVTACNNRHNNGAIETPKMDTVNTEALDTKVPPPTGIKTNIGYINVDDGGSGGIPVLFIHSFGGSTQHWVQQLQHLRTSRRATAVDLRGHGLSDAPPDNDYSVTSLADDIEVIADSLGLDTFYIVGHSMGGAAAIEFAGRHPRKVAGLLLVVTPGKMPADQAKQIISSLESNAYDTVMETYMRRLLQNASPATESLERQGMNKLSKPASIAIIKSSFYYDPLPALRKYKGPKMLVSTGDATQPNSLENTFPDIPLKKIAGTSHWIQLDKPIEFNQVLDEFLSIPKNNSR